MLRSRFRIAKMDCPSEEQLVRRALADVDGIERLEFEIPERRLTVWHASAVEPIGAALEKLGLGSALVSSGLVAETELPPEAKDQSRVLIAVLVINAVMFAVELIAGWLADSAGLLADGLDMLADALVYGLALWAVHRGPASQRRAAEISGWLQLALALGLFVEVGRRLLYGSEPEPVLIVLTSALALAANVACLALLLRHRSDGLHMRASWIFTGNDVIANLGVTAAAILVRLTDSAIPDLVIGAIIGAVVLRGAIRILGLSRGRGSGAVAREPTGVGDDDQRRALEGGGGRTDSDGDNQGGDSAEAG